MNDRFRNLARGVATAFIARKLLTNPKILIGMAIGVIFIIALSLLFLGDDDDGGGGGTGIDQEIIDQYYTLCTPIENDENFKVDYFAQFEGKGALEGTAGAFLRIANHYNVDPVLLASIAFYESGNGTSTLITDNNNPARLYNPVDQEYLTFESLEDGIERLAIDLFDNYISQGHVSIYQLGQHYAPIGDENDTANLNANWISKVTEISQSFGGLVMNCQQVNFGNGELAYPVINPRVTSNFGYRVDPITGLAGEFHKGMDFGCNAGEPIYSALEGEVQTVSSGCTIGDYRCGGGYGNYVVLAHQGKYTLYAHMTQVLVSRGNQIATSQQIGTCGTTGSSTGNHLHFEVQFSLFGNHQDPALFLSELPS